MGSESRGLKAENNVSGRGENWAKPWGRTLHVVFERKEAVWWCSKGTKSKGGQRQNNSWDIEWKLMLSLEEYFTLREIKSYFRVFNRAHFLLLYHLLCGSFSHVFIHLFSISMCHGLKNWEIGKVKVIDNFEWEEKCNKRIKVMEG